VSNHDVLMIAASLLRIPSVTGPEAEVGAVEYLQGLLDPLPGVSCDVVAGKPGRPNLIATIDSGLPGPSLLLTGHLDVVPAIEGEWTRPPFEPVVVDGELWGRGSVDMKGGLAALLAVFVEVAIAGGPACGRLVLAATADEEGEGRWGLPWLIEQRAFEADAAIVAEAAGVSDDYDRLPIATRGAAFAVIRVRAPGGHASLGRSRGEHAVGIACRLQQRIEEGFRPEPLTHWAYPDGPTVVAGEHFRGGERLGELPRNAEFTVSVRTLPGAREEDFYRDLRAFVTTDLPSGYSVDVAGDDRLSAWSPGMELDRAHPLAVDALRAVREVGYEATEFGAFPAYSEGANLAAAGIPTLPATGPGPLSRAHLPDERVTVRAVEACVEITRSLVRDVARPDWPS
jgi:succinyl-diaminopimelate desuccinylase